MANPHRSDPHLRLAHSILEQVKNRSLRKTTSYKYRPASVMKLIAQGIMPQTLPCDNPCPRDRSGPEYYFNCESCKWAKPNPFYYSSYKKASISTALRWAVWERDNFTCLVCGRRRYLSIDHIIPESKGGKTELSNLQTLCRPCN